MRNTHSQAHKYASDALSSANHQEMKKGEQAFDASVSPSNAVPSAPAAPAASTAPTAPTAPNHATKDVAPNSIAWNQIADLQRQQLAWLTECASAMFRGVGSIRKTQLEAAHQASTHHASTAHQLRMAQPPSEWLELLSAPMNVDMESCEKYWSQLAAASMQTQTEIINSIYQLFDNEKLPEGLSVSSMQKIWETNAPKMVNNLLGTGFFEPPKRA